MEAQTLLPSPCHYSCDLEVKFESHQKAAIICAALNFDKELQPGKVKRVISVSDGNLAVHFEAVEPRFHPTSFSAFVDVLLRLLSNSLGQESNYDQISLVINCKDYIAY